MHLIAHVARNYETGIMKNSKPLVYFRKIFQVKKSMWPTALPILRRKILIMYDHSGRMAHLPKYSAHRQYSLSASARPQDIMHAKMI